MAKVASRSFVEVASHSQAAGECSPIHCHYVVPSSRKRIEAVLRLPPAQQTIANMLMPRNLLRAGASGWEQIQSARLKRGQINVISGMRDPVARSISIIVFMADFYGHVSLPLAPAASLTADYVIGALQENWKLVLERREPLKSFEWLLWHSIDAFRNWFVDEFGAALEMDVLQGMFDARAAVQRIRTSWANILIYRVEDLTPEASGHTSLLAQTNAFLQTRLTSFPKVNTSSTRRSRALSEEVRRRFWLPKDMLDAIYSERVVQHFYDRDEIAAFKKRWSGDSGSTVRDLVSVESPI